MRSWEWTGYRDDSRGSHGDFQGLLILERSISLFQHIGNKGIESLYNPYTISSYFLLLNSREISGMTTPHTLPGLTRTKQLETQI